MSIYLKKIGMLDKIRVNEGIDKMKAKFSDLVVNNLQIAAKLINDKNVRFGTLFLLQPEIKRTNFSNSLSLRNKNSLDIANGILLKEISNSQRFLFRNKKDDYPTLKWILETGYMDDGLNEQFDEVLDAAAILLAKVYKDRSSLNLIEEMIFNRYRRGAFIYDLVWIYFEVSDFQSLIKIAQRLRSLNPKDVELASKLLNFIPCIDIHRKETPKNKFKCAMQWIKVNKDFLYYTGETCLQSSNPHRYALSEKQI